MESKLVDNNISLLVKQELRKTEKIAKMYNSLILNSVLFIILIIGIGGILCMKYNEKHNNDSKSEEIKKRNSLLEKVANMQHVENNINKDKNGLITNLPIFSNIL
tara:strand:+ start:2146 stop:2460 length:315 start_codon:yes stop_codon:yes gene_type:complete